MNDGKIRFIFITSFGMRICMSNYQMEKLDVTKIDYEEEDDEVEGAPYALFDLSDRTRFAAAVRAAKARRRVREHSDRMRITEEKQKDEITALKLTIKEQKEQIKQYAKGDAAKLAVADLTKELDAVTNQYETLQRGVREPDVAAESLRKIVDADTRAFQSIDGLADMIRARVCMWFPLNYVCLCLNVKKLYSYTTN